MKRYKMLRNLLVHSKDKRTVGQTGECVYKVLCHNCSSTYIGETGRSYGRRQEEHRKEVESISNRTLTRAGRKDLTAETNMSAITDHVAKENHVIDRSGAKILDRESSTNKTTQGINLHRKEVNCMNRRGSLQPTNDLWPHFGHALIVNITWPYAWWNLLLSNETSKLGTVFLHLAV